MRQIKFRAWDRHRKRFCDWREACAIVHTTNSETQMRLGIIELNNDEQSSYTFMQFTGLLDKNGKEIYEGDIVQDEYQEKYAIGFDVDVCRYYCGQENTHYSLTSLKSAYIEIIGNIYENPELLETK